VSAEVRVGDCLAGMRAMEAASVDAIARARIAWWAQHRGMPLFDEREDAAEDGPAERQADLFEGSS